MEPPDVPLDPAKFRDPLRTARGEPRASVALERLETLWFNTGTLCNIECAGCYIESGPRNDRLSYLGVDDVRPYLDEIASRSLGTREIAFTGGEPFLAPAIVELLALCLERGFRVLVLTNAMQPMLRRRVREGLSRLRRNHGERIVMRVSLDHYTCEHHERERGAGSWEAALEGLRWLSREGFRIRIAGRTCWGEPEPALRAGYAALFDAIGLSTDAWDPGQLVLFPELDAKADVPEITEACWETLGRDPRDLMCASSRMVVRRKGAVAPVVLPCTLLPYVEEFELGRTLADAAQRVRLNHPHCARFCVLGGGSCSA